MGGRGFTSVVVFELQPVTPFLGIRKKSHCSAVFFALALGRRYGREFGDYGHHI